LKTPRIIVITGASAVGKTSLVNRLKQNLDSEKQHIHHFDSIGIPPVSEMMEQFGSPSRWQEAKTHEWISKLIRDLDNRTTVLEGSMNIDFILQAFENNQFSQYKILLIDCEHQEMKRRLIEERKQPELANEAMSNWLIHLRVKATQHQIEIIDTTRKTIEESVNQVLKFLNNMATN